MNTRQNAIGRPFLAAALCLGLLVGCTTTVRMTVKDDSYQKKISSPYVLWETNSELKVRITRSSKLTAPTISAADHEESQRELSQLLSTLGASSVDELSAKLRERGQDVLLDRQSASTEIRIKAVQGVTSCGSVTPGCTHDMAIEVRVIDRILRKEVWRGGFMVGLSTLDKAGGRRVDAAVVESFVSAVTTALQRASLL